MSAMGWAKVSYYIVIMAVSVMLFLAGTVVHTLSGITLALVSPAVYRIIKSSKEDEIRAEVIEATIALAQERYWKVRPNDREQESCEDCSQE